MESMISTNYMSKMGNCSSSSDDDDSSWDFYLEDFKHSYHYQSAFETSSSMASLLNHDYSSAKRRKTQSRSAFVDHDLEDTATSPDHTSTTNLNTFTIFQKHKATFFQELHKQQQRAASSKGIKGSDEVEDGAELRKKGLCLVPLSNFVDYYVS